MNVSLQIYFRKWGNFMKETLFTKHLRTDNCRLLHNRLEYFRQISVFRVAFLHIISMAKIAMAKINILRNFLYNRLESTKVQKLLKTNESIC